jgi:tetratricopeptide (TPR) repeat protein
MTYPGNPSLSTAVKDRVLSTFQQTVTLFKQGRMDEIAAGCNLILQMDPMFDPAKKLLEKTRNPGLPLDVDSLLPRDSAADLVQARQAMADRDFERVVQITTEILTDDLMNDEARILADEARDKMEAAPFVDQFARKCEQQLGAGNVTGARNDLEKARALDPTHPAVVRMAQSIAAREAQPAARPFDASPSFVVDDAQATGRGAAAASDFGFTFEEEKPAQVASFEGFSFDSPAAAPDPGGFSGFSFDAPAAPAAPAFAPQAPAPAASTGGFDFATASISTSADDQKKIDQFLADGDRALTAGDYQQAIDLWSRIFLIDVTNEQASDRIEQAKAKRRELDQKVDAPLSSAIAAFDRNDYDRARAGFEEVLRIDPQNAAAREHMGRLRDAAAAPPPPAPSYFAPSNDLDAGFFEEEELSGSYEAPLTPPDADAVPATDGKASKKSGATKAVQPSTGRKLPVGLIAAVVGVLVLALGGWFVWSRFMTTPAAEPGASQTVLARAGALADRGKFDQAIAMLQDIQPGDPNHDKALSMIADLQQKKSSSAQIMEGMPAAQFYDQKISAARASLDGHDYAAAKRAFEEAMRVKPLPPELKPLYDSASQQVAKLDAARTLLAEGRYADAIGSLQPLLQADPDNKNIHRMIQDAHFNMGAVALQEEKLPDAIREFDEVLKVDPNDELARRSRDLAARYDGQPRDLLYQIYVKYLPLRKDG